MNLVTYGRNTVTVAAREGEVPLASFQDGMNLPASSAPGIGICTDVVNPKESDWTVNTQYGVTRDPQQTMHLGGDGTTAGSDDHLGDHPVLAIQGDQSGDGDLVGVDGNDEMAFVEALAQAAPGVGMGAGNADPINRSGVTVEIGDRVWGTNTVA